MAIYRLEAKIIGRAMGKSAVGAAAYRSGRSMVSFAAYRSGERLHDTGRDLTFDYSRKENIEHVEIMAPSGAPDWVHDREKLWNAVEAREDRAKRPDEAQLAREVLLTLPRELNADQCIALVRSFVRDTFVKPGMVADIAIHNPKASDGGQQRHAHASLTMRRLEDGKFTSKARDWNWKVKEWRVLWQDYVNAALKDAGSTARVDHRSLAARGIDRKPQPVLGPSAKHARQRSPYAVARREQFEEINHQNRVTVQAKAMRRLRSDKRLPPGIHVSMAPAIAPERTMRREILPEPQKRRRMPGLGDPGGGYEL